MYPLHKHLNIYVCLYNPSAAGSQDIAKCHCSGRATSHAARSSSTSCPRTAPPVPCKGGPRSAAA